MSDYDDIKAFIEQQPEALQGLLTPLRALVRAAAPGAAEELKPGRLVYKGNDPFGAITVHKQHINMQFYGGSTLKDADSLLEGKGKRLRHVKIRSADDLRFEALTKLVQQAQQQDAKAGKTVKAAKPAKQAKPARGSGQKTKRASSGKKT